MPNVSNLVKTIQDIMRKDAGTYGDAQRLEQLGWMFFLKIFDDREKELELLRDNYKSPLPQHLRWSNWATDDEGITGDALLDFVNNTLLPKLKTLTAGGDKIAGLIRMAFEDANNYMKNGTLMRQVINKINGIDFNASDDRHMFGDIYEKLLKDLQSAGNAGEFYTPRAVTQFIVEQVNPRLGETILDPACGTGGFLVCAIEHLRKQAKTEADERTIQDCFAGIEKKHLPHVLCMTNLLLHGIDVPSNVRHDNTLARPLRDWGPKERVDVIVTNPPFGGMEEDGIEANFPAEFRTRETADLFLVLLMKILKPGGRAGLVLARRHPLRRRRQDPHQGSAAHRVQPAHHRPPAQRRLQSLHRHPHQPALLHQGPAHHRGLVLRAPLSARRQELQQGQAHPHRGVRGRARLVGQARLQAAWKTSRPGASPSTRSRPATTTSTSRTRTTPTPAPATWTTSCPNTKSSSPRSPRPAPR